MVKSGVSHCNHLVALMEQSSNQILIDMKNIYEFKDILEFSANNGDVN
jgi:hypothetical protein